MAEQSGTDADQQPVFSALDESPEPLAGERSSEGGAGLTIVAIGASAGGLDALKRFFTAMPAHPAMAFVIVVHLSPTHASLLAELLAHDAAMPVTQALEGERVEAGHVYVIPPNHYLHIKKGVLHLEPTVTRPAIPMPIDYFMRSLAADQQSCAVGIVLSGADHDGTLGLKEIKAANGFTMAQDPRTAEHASMPQSALAATPDCVLPVEELPRALLDFVDNIAVVLPDEPQGSEALEEVLAILRARTGHDFRGYRPRMLLRRFKRRMALKRVVDFDAYVRLLREEDGEAKQLADEFLIGITEFFREPDAWRVLAEQVIPDLRARAGDAPVRVWSVGCASGQEAYSIAMLLLEGVATENSASKITVFGTDIDTRSLHVARLGKYPSNIQVSVSSERLQRFFRKTDDGGYEVRKELRATVLFAPQNVLSDPPFSRLDLVICRNLLIYLQPALQQKVLELFHFALNPGGYLFLGKSESLGEQAVHFEPLCKESRIYRSSGLRTRLPRDLPAFALDRLALLNASSAREVSERMSDPAALIQKLLGERNVRAAVLVSRDLRVLYFRGHTELYLEPPSGEPSWDLPSLARDGLRLKLRAALHQVISERQTVVIEAVVKRDERTENVCVSVEPVVEAGLAEMLLVSFNERPGEPIAAASDERPALDGASPMGRLESDLANTRKALQTAVESLETANQELRVGNEEALSTNEELQSSNEELQTAKEELQSLNEELNTVNSQLENKIEELQRSNDDLNNLLGSIDIPMLFLDGNLRIKRFTASTKRVFKLIDVDIDRQLSDIVSNLADDSLLPEAQRVFETLVPLEHEVRTNADEIFWQRILPYRTEHDRIDGVVVTFTDITELRRATEELRRVAMAVHDSNDAVIVYDLEGHVVTWNKGAARMYGYAEAEALTMDVGQLIPAALRDAESPAAIVARLDQTVETQDSQRITGDGQLIDVLLTVSLLRDENGMPWRILSTERDITERKRMERSCLESEIRFRTLADNIPALVWIDDEAHETHYVNRGFSEFTGCALETLLGDRWRHFIHPDDVERFASLYDEAFRRHAAFDVDFRLRRADGQLRWMRSTGVPRYQDENRFVGYVGLILDIHERKLAEQALAQADQRKSQFLAMLAHELRNPLTPILTSVEVMRRSGFAEAKASWAAGIIERQAHQLAGLVDELLDVARISSGKIALHKEPVELSLVVARACETTQPLIDAHHHVLTTTLPSEPLYVEGDMLRLGQILANLLTNAAKFTPDGGHIAITVGRQGEQAVISVRDSGAGIAREMLPQIFELFTQANSTLDRSQGGLGLGLTLAKELVRLHGGDIEAHSAGLGEGSEFVLRLPLMATPERQERRTQERLESGASLRVLAADDNVDAAQALALLLELVGHVVRVVHDGPSVLEVVDAFAPDVILLDIGLPLMDGYEVARRLRARTADPRPLLIAITGYGQPEDVYQAKSAGFDHHLIKPVNPEQLLALIDSAPRSRRRQPL